MAKKALSAEQYEAIAIMALPKNGGKTYDEIAKEVGVARSTLFEWKKKDEFTDALKAEMVRGTTDRLPEMFDAIIDNVVETGNAAAFRTLVQMHGMLTEKVDVKTSGNTSGDIDTIRADILRMKSDAKE